MIEIRSLGPADDRALDAFLHERDEHWLYPSPVFRDFLRQIVPGDPVTLAACRQGRIEGVLPFFVASNPDLGAIVNSQPWYGSHGGCTLARPEDHEARVALLEAYQAHCRRVNAAASTMILSPFEQAQVQTYQRVLSPQLTDDRVGQVSILPSGPAEEDVILQSYRQKTRNLVRKSLKQELELVVSDDDAMWSFLYETHLENMQAVGGRAKPRAHFDAMRSTIPPQRRRLYVARSQGRCVAAMLLFLFHRTVEYITPVIKVEHRHMQPLSFLIHHATRDAVRDGYLYWNWGGTWRTQESLHHFKAGWGAHDMPYTYLVNVTPESRDHIRANLPEYQRAFPFYYLVPF